MANSNRQYNKMALQLLNDLSGIPQGFEDVSNHLSGRVGIPCEGHALAALNYLEAAGYIKRCEATAADAPLWKITAPGMRMITRNVRTEDLDPMIWG